MTCDGNAKQVAAEAGEAFGISRLVVRDRVDRGFEQETPAHAGKEWVSQHGPAGIRSGAECAQVLLEVV